MENKTVSENSPGRWTARDLLAFINLSHEDHTVTGALCEKESLTVTCSCGEVLVLDCVERQVDVRFCKTALRNVPGMRVS